jgi:hypothetical protein
MLARIAFLVSLSDNNTADPKAALLYRGMAVKPVHLVENTVLRSNQLAANYSGCVAG